VFPTDILETAGRLVGILRLTGQKIAIAESCTGGLIAGAITSIPGSSDVFDYGFVTYSNAAKSSAIGVDPSLIEDRGAVSSDVARAMAEGALKTAGSDLAVAVTGIAGPSGGTPEKPVGLVYIGMASRNTSPRVQRYEFGDIGRAGVRLESVRQALLLLEKAVE
jgi:nicotinamide-nucleotide amidase